MRTARTMPGLGGPIRSAEISKFGDFNNVILEVLFAEKDESLSARLILIP